MTGIIFLFIHGSYIYSIFQTNSYCVKLFIFLYLCPVSSPRRFRAKVVSPTKLQVLWKEPKGEFESYKVIYTTQPGKIQHCPAASTHSTDVKGSKLLI